MNVPGRGTAVWIDGRVVDASRATTPISDPAFLAGLGLFETLAVRDGRLLDLDAHIDRMAFGARRLGVPLPAPAILRAAGREVARTGPVSRCWLKIVATRAGRVAVFCGEADAHREGEPCTAVLLPWIRSRRDPLTGLKTLNYAPFVLGLEEAARRGADDGIWTNERGHVVEACTANVFVVRQRKLFTPSGSDGILPGVVRGLALRAAREMGLVIHEGKVRLRRLERADEAFLTSSVRGVRALIRFNSRAIGSGKPGPLTRAIVRRVESLRTVDTGPSAASKTGSSNAVVAAGDD